MGLLIKLYTQLCWCQVYEETPHRADKLGKLASQQVPRHMRNSNLVGLCHIEFAQKPGGRYDKVIRTMESKAGVYELAFKIEYDSTRI